MWLHAAGVLIIGVKDFKTDWEPYVGCVMFTAWRVIVLNQAGRQNSSRIIPPRAKFLLAIVR
jgi:hypothetical protein